MAAVLPRDPAAAEVALQAEAVVQVLVVVLPVWGSFPGCFARLPPGKTSWRISVTGTSGYHQYGVTVDARLLARSGCALRRDVGFFWFTVIDTHGLLRYIRSGAEIPSMVRAFFRVWAVRLSRYRRARVRGTSSVMTLFLL